MPHYEPRANQTSLKLNLGCGRDYREGYLNVDLNENVRVDRRVDLDSKDWPFEDNSVDEIIANEVLEHLEDVKAAMSEIYRILKPDGMVRIKVPFYRWIGAFWDTTHKHFFAKESFYYFTPGHPFYIDGNPKFRILSMKFLGGRLRFWEKRHLIVEMKPVKEAKR